MSKKAGVSGVSGVFHHYFEKGAKKELARGGK
jgi:hypothetical protein